MQLGDDERDELRDTARRFLDDKLSVAAVRAAIEGDGPDAGVWSSVAELGWPAIHVAEAFGGMGASYVDVGVILHELGRHLAPLPFLSSAILGAEALVQADNAALRDEWLPTVVSGERLISVASADVGGSVSPCSGSAVRWRADGTTVRLDGVARFVPDADAAVALVVGATDAAGRVAFALLDTNGPGVRVTVEPTMDQTRRLARVELDDVTVDPARLLGEPGELTGLQRRITSLGAAAVAADALGAAEHMMEVSATYARERRQFDRPIGSFQAVKHHCANMLIAVEGARAAVAQAFGAFDDPDDDVDVAASVAKSFAGPGCARVCETAVKVHGGIGFTWEHDAHLYLKRAKLDEALFGTTAWHRRRLGAQLVAG
jgi:alkylation response protein AidB-like acyl-CoA dehydrogenase